MPIPDGVVQVKRPLAREQVYERLRLWIIKGTLRPGELIRDQSLAESLGVSRTPVREALRRLEDEGLVETAANRWTRVAPIEVDGADDLYGVVQALESYALRLVKARLTGEDLAALRRANAALAEAIGRHDAPAAVQADNEFHQVWIDRAGNAELAGILLELKARLRRLELTYFDSAEAMDSVREHESILGALERRRYGEAARAVEGNWEADVGRLSRRAARRKAAPA